MHFNDVKLLLSFSLSGPLYVVVEFAPNGNLRQFLRKRRPTREIPTTLTALRDRRPVRENGSTLTHMDLVSFSYQVCRGMEYLSSKKVCVKMWYFSDDCRNKWAYVVGVLRGQWCSFGKNPFPTQLQLWKHIMMLDSFCHCSVQFCYFYCSGCI